jgi:hypothetical protein
MKRAIFTVATGKPIYGEMAMGLARSLYLIDDPTPRAIMTDLKQFDWHRYYDTVLEPDETGKWPYLSRFTALDRMDADEFIMLDGDSLVFKQLGPIFDLCKGKSVAWQGEMRSKGEFRGRELADVCKDFGVSAVPRFNAGFTYYSRTEETKTLFAEALKVGSEYEKYGFNWFRGCPSGEVCLMIAMLHTGLGELLPPGITISHSGIGSIGMPKVNVLSGECSFVVRSQKLARIEPYVFHAHYYRQFRFYWNQLRILRNLEKYEDRRPAGYKPRWMRLRKSFESRWIKAFERHAR